MAKFGKYTLAAAIALLASGDWFAVSSTAGRDGEPSLKAGNATVTATIKEIEVDGKKELHAFLEVAGKHDGTVTVRLQETKVIPEARMMPRPITKWSKECDLSKASLDLGPIGKGKFLRHAIEASIDGKTFVRLALHADKDLGLDE